MNTITNLHHAVFSRLERADWLLPTLARFLFAAILLLYFWVSGLTKLGDGLFGIFAPSTGAFIQIFPKALEAASYDSDALSIFHHIVVISGTIAEFVLPALIIIGLMTRLAATGPAQFDVMPASDRSDDREIAKLNNNILQYLWQPSKLNMEEVREAAVSWMLRTGIGIFHIQWDQSAGEKVTKYKMAPVYDEQPVVDPETGEPVLDEITGMPVMNQIMIDEEMILDDNGQPIVEKEFFIGDIRVTAPSPLDFWVDDRYENHQDAPYLHYQYMARLEDLKEVYSKAEIVQPREHYQTEERMYQDRMRDLGSPLSARSFVNGSYLTNKDVSRDGGRNSTGYVQVHEVWGKATKKNPRGRLLISANDVILHDGENPYDHGKYPFVVIKEIPWGGRFQPLCSMEHLVPIQRSYNNVRSREIENAELTTSPILLTFTGAKINKKNIINRPGIHINCIDPTLAPQYLERKPTEVGQFNSISEKDLNDMHEISSQHDVSRGESVSYMESGLGIAALRQGDEQTQGPLVNRLGNALELASMQILQLGHQFYKEPRLLKMGDMETEVQVRRFFGSDMAGITPDANYFHVRLHRRSIEPGNKAAKKTEAMQYVQMGVVRPGEHDEWINRALELSNDKELFREDRLDRVKAKKDIEAMKNGEFIPAEPFQGHVTFRREFMTFMKSPEYYQMSEQLQKNYQMRWWQHEQFFAGAINESVDPIGGTQNPLLLGGEGGAQGGAQGPQLGRQSEEGKSLITDQGGAQRNQKTGDLKEMYGA